MLLLSTKLHTIPLISIRSGVRIGTVLSPIINPHNLHIDAFWCETVNSKTNKVLLDMDIRDFSIKGILIDDHLGLSDSDELVRLSAILELAYTLEGKTVLASKHKIGKVAEYAINHESLYIQKLYVQPPVWKTNISGTRLTFDRTSIIEVTDTHIVVSGPEEKATSAISLKANTSLANYSASTSFMSEKE
jgi:sporulation protein YlmC with PRC-barrel domain